MKAWTLRASGLLLLLASATAWSTPLRMDYVLSDLGGGVFQYDFTLTLDNNDSTWVSGQQWDWIIFGDNTFDDTLNGFDVNGGAGGGMLWTTTSFASPIASITQSQGGHNGPTLSIGTNGVALPGWMPSAVGEFLSWSGTSSVYIPDGELYWSYLVQSAGMSQLHFELAHGTNAVPEPTSFALLALGLASIGCIKRKAL